MITLSFALAKCWGDFFYNFLTMNNFRSIDELIQTLSRERALLKEMFAKRKTLSFRMDLAEPLVDYKMSRIQYLVEDATVSSC